MKEKKFEINGREYLVESSISDDNCYRLVYLPDGVTSSNDMGAIILIDDSACEDYYGDIDTVAEIMKENIREDAEKPFPWWTLLGAVFQWGSDVELVGDEDTARNYAEVLANATSIGLVDANDEDEFTLSMQMLDLGGWDVKQIHTFVNGSCGSFCLSNEWE